MSQSKPILQVQNLSMSFKTSMGNLNAIRGVNLNLNKGETIAIVGESGSGKSVTVKAIMGMMSSNQKVNSGKILYTYEENGEEKTVNLLDYNKKKMMKLYNGKHIAMVFQDPMTALNPLLTIGDQVTEGMIHHFHITKKEAWERGVQLLEEVGIPNPALCMKNYPHQLSGGMRQRIVIAIAIACDPEILICDEPTTALDVTIQAKILELIQEMQVKKNISVIYITHDLGVVAKVANHVSVMYAGKIIEQGTVNELYFEPRHPYTWGLLLAMPDLNTTEERLYTIPGTPPNLLKAVRGDAFAPRNQYALNIDFEEEPPVFELSETHKVSSWLEYSEAPDANMPLPLRQRIERMKLEGGN